ncbi:MAG: hypothetical protein WCO76_10000, partial [Planctomycetota bacterium]
MKRSAFLRNLFNRTLGPFRRLDFFASFRWVRLGATRRSSSRARPSWELLESRLALASDVDFVGLAVPVSAGSIASFDQSAADTTIVSPFTRAKAVQAAAAQTVNSVVVGGLQFQGTFTSQGGVYSTSSAVDVGFAPGSGTFKSL